MILPGFGTTGRKRTEASGWRGPEVATLPDWNSGVARKSLRVGAAGRVAPRSITSEPSTRP